MFASLAVALVLSQNALKIEDTKVGTGVMVQKFDVVEVLYTGMLLNGKVFDSNVKSGKGFRFQIGVGQVIKGWDEGFVGLKVDGERTLTIPAAMAYGEQAVGENIPANSDLKFSVKLLRILPPSKVEIIMPGTGEAIKLGQFLDCKLSVKVSNGKELADPTKSSRLQLSPRMRSWINQAVGGIKIGEKRKVVVNYEMAFGEKGVPTVGKDGKPTGAFDVPPKSDLTIMIEAVKISD